MTRILLLPGLGADARLFEAQAAVWDVVVPAWPTPHPHESLQSFAGRVVATLAEPPEIVGGASFGGMVALEIAALVHPKAVVLVGGCTSPSAVAPHLRFLGRAARGLPATLFRPRHWTLPIVLPKFGTLNASQRELFWSMASQVPSGFFKWGCSAILAWRPSPLDVPVFHLHGDRDEIIPIGRVTPTEVVHGGGHLLNLSHPAEVTAFLHHVLRTAV